jgi:two-component system response regulator PilR (NtrC family)
MSNDNPYQVLIVDDELSMREVLEMLLRKNGYRATCADSGRAAIKQMKEKRFDLLLLDIRLGDMDGIEVLKSAKDKDSDVVVIMISAHATAETAVDAMNAGAYDYVPKPFDTNELLSTIEKALDLKSLDKDNLSPDDALKETLHFGRLVGNSPRMQYIYGLIRQVSETDTSVLVTGESGTGKELIARAIHEESQRRDEPFVAINCGGIPETLMESELFGHKKGAFTGADKDKKGLFQAAHKGSIFLDEIGELPIPVQVKLLRAIQERTFKPVGGNEDISVDIRIISATNKNLEEEVIGGRFREDLFYRLNVIEIKIPPLRERKADLRLLAQHFLDKYSRKMKKEMTKISSYAIDLLTKYDFPGNVRELENLMERSVALSSTNILLPDSLAMSIHKRRWVEGVKDKRYDLDEVVNGVSLDVILVDIERAYLERALEESKGNKQKAAELLDINIRSLRYRLEKLEVGSDS